MRSPCRSKPACVQHAFGMLRPQTGDKTTLARRVFRHSQTAHPGQAQRVAPSLFTSMEVTPLPPKPSPPPRAAGAEARRPAHPPPSLARGVQPDGSPIGARYAGACEAGAGPPPFFFYCPNPLATVSPRLKFRRGCSGTGVGTHLAFTWGLKHPSELSAGTAEKAPFIGWGMLIVCYCGWMTVHMTAPAVVLRMDYSHAWC